MQVGDGKVAKFLAVSNLRLRCTTAVFVRKDDGVLAEQYRPSVINNVRSKSLTMLTVVMFITLTTLTLRPFSSR